MGGFPSKNTPKDRRLKKNRAVPARAPQGVKLPKSVNQDLPKGMVVKAKGADPIRKAVERSRSTPKAQTNLTSLERKKPSRRPLGTYVPVNVPYVLNTTSAPTQGQQGIGDSSSFYGSGGGVPPPL